MSDATAKTAPKWKTALTRLVVAASYISLGWMGPGLMEQFGEPTPQDLDTAGTPAVMVNPAATGTTLSHAETGGLLTLGAAYGNQLAKIQDPRDLCRAVKANAALTSDAEPDYSAEFESCATRNLHYDAALLQAGALAGQSVLQNAGPGDLCALQKVAALRADMKNTLQAGQEIASHDQSLQSLQSIFTDCQGEYKIDNQKWNAVANQMVLLPFYQPAKP